jgi:serine/threonine-protein kinase
MNPSLSPGTKLGRYEIRSQLGAGGMGEVYLALDTELDRTVAIKILPEALASDPDRLQRFVQEAKSASALNHPHILTIYEIGTVGSTRFIATELIEGDTLGQRIRSASLSLNEVLEIATQIAGALSVAHAAGIIHRDIKPENIMVRRDGYIKLLDFGLAKLTEPQGSTTDTEAPTKALVNTDAGTVMGTANYMSPEQAKGTNVDTRTDLWSLGAVIYEMVSGHVPFPGETPTETISLILQREAMPLARYVHDLPAELERIIAKTLTKDREERYQSAKDLLIDLRTLKRKLEVDAEIDRTVPPEMRQGISPTGGETQTASGGMRATVGASGSQSSTPSGTGSPSSAEYVVSGIKQHKIVAGLVVMALAASVIGFFLYRHARDSEAAIESIAVLPFENQNRDTSVEWLSDGVTESIINNLAQLPNLRVSPRSTVFHYKGAQVDPLAVGKELGVRAVLSGRFLQTGDNVTISVELVDVRDNKQIWGDRFNHKVADVLAMQQEISQQISERLRLTLSGTEQQKMIAKRNPTNAEAYQFYLKGRYFWNQRSAEGIRKAVDQFQQAIDRDPNYALAYTGLADCYLLLEQYAGVPSSETIPKARPAVERALQLDDSLAEAHTSMASVYETLWQWSKAEEEYKRAISLNPNYPTAHHWYQILLRSQGRLDEALAEIKLAQQLDPLAPILELNLATIYFEKNDFDSALIHARRILEINPKFPLAHEVFGEVYLKQGRYAEAVAEFEQDVAADRTAYSLSSLGYASALAGRRDQSLAIVKELEEKYAKHEALGQYVAAVYVGLGDKDKAFYWLEKEFQSHGGGLPLDVVAVHGFFYSLRGDPRYTNLVARMGLKPL